MEGKLYQKVCANCGAIFEAKANQRKYCSDCITEKNREANRRAMRKKRMKSKILDIPLHRFVYLNEKYNRENGVFVTYGKFEQMMHNGQLDEFLKNS